MEKAEHQTAMENQTISAMKARYNVIMMRPDIFGDEKTALTQAMLVQCSKALKGAECNKRKPKIAMDGLRCPSQDDQVKSSTSDKNLIVARQGRIQVNVPLHLRKDQASF